MEKIAIASSMLKSPTPSRLTIRMARTMPGKANRMSMNQESARSMRPPK